MALPGCRVGHIFISLACIKTAVAVAAWCEDNLCGMNILKNGTLDLTAKLI